MWVLDTNTLIYFFKGEGRVAERLLAHPPKDIGIPAIVIYELEVGIAKSRSPEKRSRQLKELTRLVRLLPFHHHEAQAAANIRATLEHEGCPIGPYDTLVSRNTREFERIKGLPLENWYE